MAILNTATLRDQVIATIGIDRILGQPPDSTADNSSSLLSRLQSKIARLSLRWGLIDPDDAVESARQLWDRSINIKSALDTSTIYISFRHSNPDTAKAVVDAIIAAYFNMRRSIFANARDGYTKDELSLRRSQYEEAIRALRAFEGTQGGGDLNDLINRTTDDIASLEDVIAGLDRDIAGQLGSLKITEVAGPSSGQDLSAALGMNVSLAGLEAEHNRAQAQLDAARLRLSSLSDKTADDALLKRSMESAEKAYEFALEQSRQTEIDAGLKQMGFSNVKLLQAGTVPRTPVDLPLRTLVALSAGFAFGFVLVGLVLFGGRRRILQTADKENPEKS